MTKEEIKILESTLKKTPEEAEKIFRGFYLTRRLKEHNGNVTKTAETLGWTRAGLQKAIKRLNEA